MILATRHFQTMDVPVSCQFLGCPNLFWFLVIPRAEEDGRLKPGDTVVEYTGGSTGTALALVCAAKGYRLQIIGSDAFSQ